MMAIALLAAGTLGVIMILTFLYFLVTFASDATGVERAEETPNGATANQNDRQDKKSEPQRAIIRCAACPPQVPYRFRAAGYTECNTIHMVFGGNSSCGHGCLGLGTCAAICPNDAIIIRAGTVYISDSCNGCGHCVGSCPRKLIELVPANGLDRIFCAANGKNDNAPLCPIALADERHVIDYRNFPLSGFKILHKWGILSKKSR